jgi:manganese/zinc/iron transport system substrate-binding protein
MRKAAVLLAVVALAGCGDESGSSGGRQVVATTTQIADLVRQMGGGRVSVDGMLRPGGDPHD